MEQPDMFDVIKAMMNGKMDIQFIPLMNLSQIKIEEDSCLICLRAPLELGKRLEKEQFKGALFIANSAMFEDTFKKLVEKQNSPILKLNG